ncbi:MAG: hypothetical protein JHD16_01935 [Solirubrobacteraceae bacterium]|nr:hypothetical protein [Solirubrobacteraceae bacterium]
MALAPLLAAAAVLAWPCDCADHPGHRTGAALVAGNAHTAGHTGHGPAPKLTAAHPTSAGSPESPTPGQAPGPEAMAFEVGTSTRPLVARGARGPLWQSSVPSTPGTSKHGTPAQQTIATQLEQLRQPGGLGARASTSDPVGQRAVLTTREATKRLSARCQRLINASRRSLTRKEKQARLRCVRERRTLVASANGPIPGVSAPAAPIQGPAPTTAPPTASDPAPSTTPTGPAPTTPTAPTAPTAPAKQYAAAGVIATDGDDPFRLTRGSATADIVNFELDNTDRQDHDLYIAPADQAGDVTGPLVEIIGRIAGGTRASADVELAPGRYKLICTVPGHGPMAVNFTVYAPR